MSATNTDLTALVTVLGGMPTGVVIGTDVETLEAQGQTFVEQQGSNAYYELCNVACDIGVLPGALYRPRLRPASGGHRDFQVVAGDHVIALIEVFPRQRPWSSWRTAKNRAVEFVLGMPDGSLAYRQTYLTTAADYLQRLGIDPGPLWELAERKGWRMPEEVAR
jgi:hypothetical protein